MKYFDVNGVSFDDSDIEKWGAEAEAGFPNSVLEKVEPRAWERDVPMQAKSVRMPVGVWNLVASRAKAEGITVSDYVRLAVSKELIAGS